MKITLILSLLISLNLYAYNLSEIIESSKVSNKTKAILDKKESKIAQNELFATYKSPNLGLSVSHAKDSTQDGAEYSMGISQDINHPFSISSKEKGVKEFTQAIQQETMHELHLITLDIASKYHSACIAKEMQDKAKELFEEEGKRFAQLQKAYELGEISKKDLLFSKLDLAKLHQSVNTYKRAYLEQFSSLQKSVDNLLIDTISCQDLLLPVRHVELTPISEHDELKTITYKQNSSKAFYAMHDSLITSLGYELLYEQELDTQRYTLGLSIPLGGVTSEKEKLKAEQLFLSSAYSNEKASIEAEIKNASGALVLKLEALYDEMKLLEDEVLPLNEALVKLSKSALVEGEGTMLEYLDAARSYSLNLLEMLEIKKTYYYELFELYKTADLEFGE
ncbi:TolC family protein [bacterium]|nr:TolC family protein [bacterium]MBU1993314.1 TolC family protein [bacterium]